MTYVKEFLEFLVNINNGIVERNGEKETEHLRNNLTNIISFLRKCIETNSFDIKKFKVLCDLCRNELRSLVAGGYAWIPNADRSEIVRKFDNFELAVIHFIEHLGTKFQTQSQMKIVIKHPIPGSLVDLGYLTQGGINVEAVVFGPNGEIINNFEHDYLLFWYIVATNAQAPVGRGTSLAEGRKCRLQVPGQFRPGIPIPSVDNNLKQAKLVARLQRKEDHGTDRFVSEAQANLTFYYQEPQGHSSRYHIPNPKMMSNEEAKLVAAINKYYRHGGCLAYYLKRLHINAFAGKINATRNALGFAENIFFQADNDGFWFVCKIHGSSEAVAVPVHVDSVRLRNEEFHSILEGFDRYSNRVRAVRIYRAAHLIEVRDNKYKLSEKGYLLLSDYPDPGFQLPLKYEEISAKESPIEEPQIELKLQQAKNEFYLSENLSLNLKFNKADFISQWDFSLIDNEKIKIMGYNRRIENFQQSVPAKDLGLGEHSLAARLDNLFGNERHLYSNTLKIKIIREGAVIVGTGPYEKHQYYLNEIVELRASIVKVDLSAKRVRYLCREISSGRVIMEGIADHHQVIIRTPASEFGEGEHSIVFSLIDVFGPNESLTSKPITIKIIGNPNVQISSPANDPNGQRAFFDDEKIQFKAVLQNFAIVPNFYNCKIIDEKSRNIAQGSLIKKDISFEVQAYYIGRGKHEVTLVIEKNGYPPIKVLSSAPIVLHVKKRTVLHKIGLRKR